MIFPLPNCLVGHSITQDELAQAYTIHGKTQRGVILSNLTVGNEQIIFRIISQIVFQKNVVTLLHK